MEEMIGGKGRPFEFRQCISILKSTGRKAVNLRQLREIIAAVSDDSACISLNATPQPARCGYGYALSGRLGLITHGVLVIYEVEQDGQATAIRRVP